MGKVCVWECRVTLAVKRVPINLHPMTLDRAAPVMQCVWLNTLQRASSSERMWVWLCDQSEWPRFLPALKIVVKVSIFYIYFAVVVYYISCETAQLKLRLSNHSCGCLVPAKSPSTSMKQCNGLPRLRDCERDCVRSAWWVNEPNGLIPADGWFWL